MKFLNLNLDTSLGGSDSSDYAVSSQKAVKTYVDSAIGSASSIYTETVFIATDQSSKTYNIGEHKKVQVYLDGIQLTEGTGYNVSGTTLTFTENLPVGSEVKFVIYGAANIGFIPKATTESLGIVQVGDGLSVDDDGVISADAVEDTKVSQVNSVANSDFRVLLSYSAGNTTEAETVKKSANFKANPNTGDMTVSGAFYAGRIETANGPVVGVTLLSTSDQRQKKNIESVDRDLSGLEAKHYILKKDGKEHIGLIAQEVMKTVPEAVSADEKGFYSMDYNAIVALLVNKVNQLEARVKQLENK